MRLAALTAPHTQTAEAQEGSLGGLLQWQATFRTLQSAEVWQAHGEWVSSHDARFGPGIRERFEMASRVQPADVDRARQHQQTCVR